MWWWGTSDTLMELFEQNLKQNSTVLRHLPRKSSDFCHSVENQKKISKPRTL
jgi:hypothetical protein